MVQPQMVQNNKPENDEKVSFNSILLIILVCIFVPNLLEAKTQHSGGKERNSTRQELYLQEHIKEIERSLTPLLQAEIGNKTDFTISNHRKLTQRDMHFLARNWSSLSASFRALYQRFIDIPNSFTPYVSPSGNFEIYYTLRGDSAVDPQDSYGYGYRNDWRRKVWGSNGVPDYVDEVAWAFDSAWQMEVERFSFPAPAPYNTYRYLSDRYKVVISKQVDGDYGITYPWRRIDGKDGFSSIISIRNEWDGWDTDGFDYETHPEKAVRVTAAHEFFHAIQYSLTRIENNGPAYLPLTWLEGTAVLMEELAFDSINDYIQYVDVFFSDPSYPFLNDTKELYHNSLITLFLYETVYDNEPSIEFIRDVFMYSYSQPLSFHQLLEKASLKANKSWSDIMSSFFTESYFTGSRAKMGVFIEEANLLPQWHYNLDSSESIVRTIDPYSMEYYSHVRKPQAAESLSISIETNQTPSWGVKAILLSRDRPDTIIDISTDHKPAINKVIHNWLHYDTILVTISNTNPEHVLEASVHFNVQHYADTKSHEPSVFPNPVARDDAVRIMGKNIQAVKIYSLKGNVIASLENSRVNNSPAFMQDPEKTGYLWKTKNTAGKSVICGTYIALVEYLNPNDDELSRKRFKILVKP